jgi:hypothetical protein
MSRRLRTTNEFEKPKKNYGIFICLTLERGDDSGMFERYLTDALTTHLGPYRPRFDAHKDTNIRLER